MTHVSRRQLARGATWVVPTVAVAAIAPAYAASARCTREIDPEIDAYIAEQAKLTYCNGAPATLDVQINQAASAIDGYAQTATIKVTNKTGCALDFSALGLHFDVQIRNNVQLTTAGTGRSILAVNPENLSTSSYTTSSVSGQPVGSVNHDIDWDYRRTLANGGVFGLQIQFGDGLASTGRWTDYVTITPVYTPKPVPTYAATGGDATAECKAYYDQRISEIKPPLLFRFSGPLGTTTVPSGATVSSKTIGNYMGSATTGGNVNGIF